MDRLALIPEFEEVEVPDFDECDYNDVVPGDISMGWDFRNNGQSSTGGTSFTPTLTILAHLENSAGLVPSFVYAHAHLFLVGKSLIHKYKLHS